MGGRTKSFSRGKDIQWAQRKGKATGLTWTQSETDVEADRIPDDGAGNGFSNSSGSRDLLRSLLSPSPGTAV